MPDTLKECCLSPSKNSSCYDARSTPTLLQVIPGVWSPWYISERVCNFSENITNHLGIVEQARVQSPGSRNCARVQAKSHIKGPMITYLNPTGDKLITRAVTTLSTMICGTYTRSKRLREVPLFHADTKALSLRSFQASTSPFVKMSRQSSLAFHVDRQRPGPRM